jgi:hypothetical protein
MADTTRLDKFSSTFLKADGDLLDKSVQRRHLAIDILKGDTGATGATGATGPTGPKGDTGASSSSQLFTSSGTFTAPAGVTKVLVTMIGGGGSGGGYYSNHVDTYSAGGGGAGGDYVWKLAFTVVPASNYTVTVGVGGVAAGEGANGNTGGNTTFDTVLDTLVPAVQQEMVGCQRVVQRLQYMMLLQ